MPFPNHFSVREIHAVQLAESAEQKSFPTVNHRRRARELAVIEFAARGIVQEPDQVASAGVEAAEDVALVRRIAIGHKDVSGGDRQTRGKLSGKGRSPQENRRTNLRGRQQLIKRASNQQSVRRCEKHD